MNNEYLAYGSVNKRYEVTLNVHRTISVRSTINKKVQFFPQTALFICVYAKKLYIRHAPSLNKFRVGIHSESTVASCGTYAK